MADRPALVRGRACAYGTCADDDDDDDNNNNNDGDADDDEDADSNDNDISAGRALRRCESAPETRCHV